MAVAGIRGRSPSRLSTITSYPLGRDVECSRSRRCERPSSGLNRFGSDIILAEVGLTAESPTKFGASFQIFEPEPSLRVSRPGG